MYEIKNKTLFRLVSGIFGFVSEFIQICLFYWHLAEAYILYGRRNAYYAVVRRLECMHPHKAESWSLDYFTLRFMLPRIQIIADGMFGYPPHLSEEEWWHILNEMTTCIRIILQDTPEEVLDAGGNTSLRYTANQARMYEHVLNQLKKYYPYMWI